MKILELTNFSAGICGVWQRVKQESLEFSKKGHEVLVVSSNRIQGSNEIAPPEENLGKVKIMRLGALKLTKGGSTYFNFEEIARGFNPEIIIAHVYRQVHTTKALKLAKKLGAKVFLVTHAPFIENNSTRSILESLAVNFYDCFIGPKILNKFDRILHITKWELPYLQKMGVKKEKLFYSPNGIPEEFFNQKKSKEEKNKILFLGRISPIKNLETVIEALALLKNKSMVLELVGPAEEDYLKNIKKLIDKKDLSNPVNFLPPIYNLKEKIKKIDSCEIFILPSKREAMPQALIEAMAREKIVIASDNRGAKEIVQDNKNGFIFTRGDAFSLAKKIKEVSRKKKVKKNAKDYVKRFRWKKLINDLENLFC